MSLLSSVKSEALALGFDACGVARCHPMPEEGRVLDQWLAAGHHAGMGYMENYAELRIDPAKLVEGAKSVIVCLISYKTDRTYPPGIPQIAAYARSADYHYTIKGKLEQLLSLIKKIAPRQEGRCFVDSAPVLEKNWGVEAGLGWMGRNSLLIHRELGSFCFIGTILTTLELDEYDLPYLENGCGKCRRCIENCPAGAILENRTVDANRCFSYQTIENRDPVPDELVAVLGERLFGCDTCQDVCPWNKLAEAKKHPDFKPIEGLYGITPAEWQAMGSGEFKRRFGHTPLARGGLKKIKQTLLQRDESSALEEDVF